MQKVRFAVRFKRGTSLDPIQCGDHLNYRLLESIFILLTTREYVACDLQGMKIAKREVRILSGPPIKRIVAWNLHERPLGDSASHRFNGCDRSQAVGIPWQPACALRQAARTHLGSSRQITPGGL